MPIAEVSFDLRAGDADYIPLGQFLTAEETTSALRSWTRNQELHGDDFRIFGLDGTGGFAAFWLVRAGRPVAEQPVVFFGGEGEFGVVAPDLSGFLWVLAEGFGPAEAADECATAEDAYGEPRAELTAIAERFVPGGRRPAREIIKAARAEFPDFEDHILGLCPAEES